MGVQGHHHLDAAFLQGGVQVAEVDLVHIGQIPAPEADVLSFRVGDACTEGLQRTEAAVAGTGVAATDQNGVDVFVQRGGDQLAHAVGRGDRRIPQVTRHQPEAGGSCHFHDGNAPGLAAQQGIVGFDRLADRAGDGFADQTAARRFCEHFGRAFTAVGHGQGLDVGTGNGAAHAGADGAGHGVGVERFLEAGGGDQNVLGDGGSHESTPS